MNRNVETITLTANYSSVYAEAAIVLRQADGLGLSGTIIDHHDSWLIFCEFRV